MDKFYVHYFEEKEAIKGYSDILEVENKSKKCRLLQYNVRMSQNDNNIGKHSERVYQNLI